MSWPVIELGSELTRSPEKASPQSDPELPFVGLDAIAPNSMKVDETAPFGTMKSLGSRFRAGDVLYSRLRPYLNKVWHADRNGACSGELLVLRTSGKLDPRFLAYRLHGREFVEYASHAVTGDRPRLDFKQLAAFHTSLPPIDTQRRIVARIDELFSELDDGEEELRRARADLATYRKSLLKAAVTGELTADWREANPSTETAQALLGRLLRDRTRRLDAAMQAGGRKSTTALSPDASNLRDIPDSWCWTTVAAAGDVLLGRQRAPEHHAGDDMRPYLRVANVMEGRLDLKDVKQMNFTPREFEIVSLRYGDVLLNEGQSPDLLGRPAIYRDEIDGCCFQKTLLRFRPSPAVLPEFALAVFRHYMHSKRFLRESRITTNIGHLTQIRFLPMEFPLAPLEEQREIIARLDEAEAVWDGPAFAPDVAATLRQSILAAAFRGDLVQ